MNYNDLQIEVAKYHFPRKEISAPWENLWSQVLERKYITWA
jgi:hypothetical protein